MFFGKQKFDVKQLKLNKFIFDVKQMKMSRFIKSISDLIISTSNATLEVPSLRPCTCNDTGYNLRIYNNAGIPAKRGRISSRPTGIM